MPTVTAVLAALVDLVLPRRCVGCERPGAALCPRCRPTGAPRVVPVAAMPVVAAAAYLGAIRRAVISYKERGRRDLARPLGDILGVSVAALLGSVGPARGSPASRPVVLVPVPSTRTARAARGGDHLAAPLRRAARACAVPTAPGVLGHRRAVADSSGLGVAGREANVAGALWARAPLSGLDAVLIDDVLTTGATLREARRALVAAGWRVRGAAVIAATPRRSVRGALAAPRGAV